MILALSLLLLSQLATDQYVCIKENKAPARAHPKARTCRKQETNKTISIGVWKISITPHRPCISMRCMGGWLYIDISPSISKLKSYTHTVAVDELNRIPYFRKSVYLVTKRVGRVERVIPRTSINCDKPRLGNHQKTSPHGKLVVTSYRFSSSLAGHSEYYCGLKVVA